MKNARENQMKAVPKVSKSVVFAATLACLIVLACTATYAQITPSQDAYTNTANPTTNYGANVLLDVNGAMQIAYIQFNLASIPSGSSVSQATLKLYANAVTKAGSFNVDYVNGTWSENTITSNMAPALGNAIASNVSLTAADKNQYILIDITAALQAWLSGTANDGIALVANGNFNATFDSKENTTTSHPAELDIVFAGGGTITGVTTANGSGLTGARTVVDQCLRRKTGFAVERQRVGMFGCRHGHDHRCDSWHRPDRRRDERQRHAESRHHQGSATGGGQHVHRKSDGEWLRNGHIVYG